MLTAFEYVLSDDRLFGTTPITAVARMNLDVVINACDLRTGTAFRFGNRASGGWRYGHVDSAQGIAVAKAVAASARYPLILPPLVETFLFTRGGKQSKETVVLTDGGVFDNLGVTLLEPGRDADISVNVYKPDYILCLNASAGHLEGSDSPTWWPPV
jgi:NTE family protein